jgi:hypothetical protein
VEISTTKATFIGVLAEREALAFSFSGGNWSAVGRRGIIRVVLQADTTDVYLRQISGSNYNIYVYYKKVGNYFNIYLRSDYGGGNIIIENAATFTFYDQYKEEELTNVTPVIVQYQNYGNITSADTFSPKTCEWFLDNYFYKKPLIYDGTNWLDCTGNKYDAPISGTTAERPTNDVRWGFMYFDTDLQKPIWKINGIYVGGVYYSAAWIDATGTVV